MLQEVTRWVLEQYYEPRFSNSSHGFRPNRGCHTALITVRRLWSGTKWFTEGDIKGCFDNIDHEILLSIIRECETDKDVRAGSEFDWLQRLVLNDCVLPVA